MIFRNTAALKINRKIFVRKKLWRDTAPLQGFFMSASDYDYDYDYDYDNYWADIKTDYAQVATYYRLPNWL